MCEYVQRPQKKYFITHHKRDLETGLDYRGACPYDCMAQYASEIAKLAFGNTYIGGVYIVVYNPYNPVAGHLYFTQIICYKTFALVGAYSKSCKPSSIEKNAKSNAPLSDLSVFLWQL
ncbi:MAG: hypothetical protein IPO27_13300 [Bacteroidetes bacterium]|nr:hypothetical protein [Bacteroidota bacterium]